MRKKRTTFFNKYINGTKGVISLFLAILMTPFVTIAGALINAGRLNSAVAIFDEALCNASNSALGTYDDFLRSRFGLMAMSQDPSKFNGQLGYTTEDFVQELFVYYMEQNLGTLNNTYQTTSLTGTGIYPLGDTTVLRSSILQASKITVPAKLAVEWGSLEDFTSMLTKPFALFSSIENTLSAGANVVTNIDKLTDKQAELEAQIDACDTARTPYDTAYKAFEEAVNNYNTLIGNIDSAKSTLKTRQQKVNELNAQVNGINTQIENKQEEIKELKEDKDADHKEEIKTLEEEIEELKKEREAKVPGYNKAVKDRDAAQRTLDGYTRQFSGKQQAVVNTKTEYSNKIGELQTAIQKTKSLAVGFQEAAKNLVSSATTLISSATSTGLQAARESCDKQKQQLNDENEVYKEKMAEATAAGDSSAATEYYYWMQANNSTIADLEAQKDKYKNTDKVVSGAVGAMNDVSSGLTQFANRDLEAEYDSIYNALEKCKTNLSKLTVPSSYTKISFKKSDYYVNVKNPIEKAEVAQIIENVEDQIVNNSGWTILKTLFSFLDALLNLELNYNPDLKVVINTDHYSANGGLPSQISRTQYPISNPYASEDAAQALEYKKDLNSYSSEDVYEVMAQGESEAEKIEGYLTTIKSLVDPFKLKNIKALWDAVTGLVGSLVKLGASFVGDGISTMLKGMRDRFYLVGYASYYTANRTTYQGKALTGASFNLPQNGMDNGYVFSGAELEYVFKGKMSEIDNQKATFTSIWVERMVFDIYGVLSDPLVQSLAASVGAVTFGIGDIVIKLVFLAVEALIDTVILVNKGEIPIIKNFVYLSPTGLPRLLEKVCTLAVSDALKQSLYEKSTEVATNVNNKASEFALEHADFTNDQKLSYERYDYYKQDLNAEQKENKIRDMFNMDYTKSIQIFMLLFGNNEKIVKRLADIIQMEATYNVYNKKQGYTFNLDKSYTYIRASGSFSSGVFMKVADETSYNSKNRVMYNGY